MNDERVHHHRGKACRADFAAPGATQHYPPDLSVEPVHLDIDLRLDLDQQTASGVVTHTLRGNRAGARQLVLHAVDFEALALDAHGEKVDYEYNGREIRIVWDKGFGLGEQRQLSVRYRVTKPVSGLFFSMPDAGYPDAPYFAVTDHETERARHWLPTIDLPAIRPTLSFHLRAAQRFTIVANGAHIRDQLHEDGTKTSHYKLEQRCPSYLTCFIVGDFIRHDDQPHGDKPIAYFAPAPFTPEMLQRSFGRTGPMLKWIEGKLGSDLPWPKYFQFAARGIGGAMENISLVSWDDRWVADEALHAELGPLIDVVNLHEMAHSWFGDLVVVRDYAHAWLKESWATYMESCWLEDTRGREEQLYDLFACGQSYLDEADNSYKRPIVTRHFNTSWNMYDRHLYPGGAYRLHMLRCKLGDEVFWKGTRTYLTRFAGKTVETEDFRRTMEEASGRSLVQWFEQWLYSRGYPDLEIKFNWDGERKLGTFDLKQRQVKNRDEPRFDFDLLLGWTVAGQTRTERVEVQDAHAVFSFPMAESPEQLQINADGQVLCKLTFDPGEKLLKAMLLDPQNLLGRIHAGWTLAASGKRAQVEAVRDAYLAEPFWGVRAQFARALGSAGTETALTSLLALLDHDRDPLTVPTLIAMVGRYRDPRVVTALQHRLGEGLGPKATEAAYVALGKQRERAPRALLEEASNVRGIAGAAQSGALLGLAESRQPGALAVLLERLQYGAIDPRARPVGARAMGKLARFLEPGPRSQAIEALVDLLRDPDGTVSRAAAEGLGQAQAQEAIGALQTYRNRITAQEQDLIDRIVASIRASGREGAAQDQRQQEELRDQLRKLEARLTELEGKLARTPTDRESN